MKLENETETIVKLYLEEKMSLAAIAAKYGSSSSSVLKILQQAGVPRRGNRQPPVPFEDIRRLYVDERKTLEEVAKTLGISKQAIQDRLSRHGVSRRTTWRKVYKPISRKELWNASFVQKLNRQEIAAKFKVSVPFVREELKRHGIEYNAKFERAKIDGEVLRKLYTEDGLTTPQLVSVLHKRPQKICDALAHFKIPIRRERRNPPPPALTKDELQRLYVDEKLSIGKVAKKAKCGRTSIYRLLEKYKIPIREHNYRKKVR